MLLGEKKTPNPFIVACDKFIYIEILQSSETLANTNNTSLSTREITESQVKVDPIDRPFIQLLKSTIEDVTDESGWSFLAEVGGLIIKKKPDFDPRNYGFSKLTPLIKSLNSHFIVEEREVEGKKIKHIFVKIKE